MQEYSRRRNEALAEVAKAARAVLPVLKDHNLNNTASELSEKLFQLDSIEQETRAFIQADPYRVLEALLKSLER